MHLRRPVFAAVLAAAAWLAAPSATAYAQHAHHGQPIVVPEGAGYTAADVEFMQGMIAHHAQAIHMSRMAEARGANPRILRLANKIARVRAELLLSKVDRLF